MKAVNLLPGESKGAAKAPAAAKAATSGSALGAYAVLAVLAFAVLAVAAYTLTTNSIKDRQAELARVSQETEQVQAKASALQRFADFKSVADQRVATVRGLSQSRFDWDRALSDLSRALPSDVHLKSLSGTTGTQVGGSSTNALRGAIQAPAVELSGCTTSQSAVARLMSRLRNVRGVTRVALQKSDKDAGGGAAVAPSADANGRIGAVLCPKGAPPAFELVVFFERAVVAAGASPNVGAAPPTTTTSAPAASNSTGSTTPPPAGGTQPPTAGGTSSASGTTTQGVSAR